MLRYGHLLNFLSLAVFFSVLGGCTANDEPADEPAYLERSVHRIYNSAIDFLEIKEYKAASMEFNEVERQHPYSTWATKSQLMSAYANYLDNQYPEAISGLQRFIQLHPAHKDTAYAYYLKALSYYEQISDVGRDQDMTERALKGLREVVRRFPKTKYASDSRLKIDFTIDHLAGKEMDVGRFYQDKKQYLAAINRFKLVADKFQKTSHLPESLLRLVESYLALGLRHEAKKVGSVLGHNYPGSEWYSDAYALLESEVSPKPQKKSTRQTESAVADEPWYKFW